MDIFTVDAFSDKPFSGNPAAVCLVEGELEADTMQAIAMEMNLSETAFVSVHAGERGAFGTSAEFDLRWFTPTCEVPLCGHATMATAAVIFRKCNNQQDQLCFHTLSGLLKVVQKDDSIYMDLPMAACVPQDSSELSELIPAVVRGLAVQDCQFAPSVGKLLLRLADHVTVEQLKALKPSAQALLAAHQGKVRGVIVTMAGKGDYDFLSRYFAPWNGIPEDPVTGSAHAVLGGYWSSRLGDKKEMRARQCSPRGGDVIVNMDKEDKGLVTVGGRACIVTQGKLYL